MRGPGFIVLIALSLAGCRQSEEQTRRAGWLQSERARARTLQRYYAELRPFERATLETFGSDSDLYQYLDAVAFIRDTGVLEDVHVDVPQLPLELTRRLQARAVPAERTIGVRPYGPWAEPLSRLVRQGDWIYALDANRVVTFKLEGRELRWQASVTLGAPIPPPTNSRSIVGYAKGELDGVAVFDCLFLTDGALVAVGNRQDLWALEIIRFTIEDNGELRRTDARWVHYSGQQLDGYRARLVGDTLVIYFRDNLFHGRPSVYTLPSLGAADAQGPVHDLLRGQDVYRPLLHADTPRMHTLLRCPLSAATLSCSAQAWLGPDHASIYIASDALYLWLVGFRPEGMPVDDSYLYRVPLDGAPPSAVRVRGHPHWNVPMHVSGDALHAVVERATVGELELLRLPTAMFSAAVPPADQRHYRRVQDPAQKLDAEDTTFIGKHMLWAKRGDGDGYFMRYSVSAQTVQVVPLDGGAATQVPIDHAASFVTELAGHALIAGTDSWNLRLSVIELEPGPARVVAKHVIRDAVRDLSSHGAASPLLTIGKTHWLTLDIAPIADGGATRLPLRWTPPSFTMQPAPALPLPFVMSTRLRTPVPKIMRLDADTIAIRAGDQLRTYAVNPSPALLQSLRLAAPE